MAEQEARFALRLDADAEPAKEAAAELERFRSTIEKSQSAIAQYRKSMSLLKGSSDEVKDAQKQLRAAIDLEKASITKANLGILKLGGSYEKLSKASKKTKTDTEGLRKAIGQIGGPAQSALERFDGIRKILPGMSSGMGLLAVGSAAAALAIVAVGAALVGATLKLANWVLETANANRNLAINREAFSGSASEARTWGKIIENTSKSVALTNSQLNDLAIQTEKVWRGMNISGQGIADAFHAAAAAAGAGREDVAGFFNEILERGKITGRVQLQFADLARFRNAGISAQQVYKSLGISAADAARGVLISTDRMAGALRTLSENRFADVNAKKMKSLDMLWTRFQDNLARLVGEGGAFEPLLDALDNLVKSFDAGTENGKMLRELFSQIASITTTLVTAFISFASSSTGLDVIKATLAGIAGVALVVVAAIALVGAAMYGIVKLSAIVWDAFLSVFTADWAALGRSIVDGIKNGLTSAWSSLKSAVSDLGQGVKDTLKGILGIHSPSTVGMYVGRMTAAGVAGGLTSTQPMVRKASAQVATATTAPLVAAATSSPATTAGGAGGADNSRSVTIGPVEVNVTVQAGHANGRELVQTVQSRSFIEPLEAALRLVLQSAAIPPGG